MQFQNCLAAWPLTPLAYGPGGGFGSAVKLADNRRSGSFKVSGLVASEETQLI